MTPTPALIGLSLALLSWTGMVAAQEQDAAEVRLIDNGFCAGVAWVTLLPGEVVTRDVGPDFYVYRGQDRAGHSWGIYDGFAGQSQPDRDHVLVRRNETPVYRGEDGQGIFNGYFVGGDRSQNHFFGDVFGDEPADARFFDRVELGDAAEAKC